jgi:hypothetical protein
MPRLVNVLLTWEVKRPEFRNCREARAEARGSLAWAEAEPKLSSSREAAAGSMGAVEWGRGSQERGKHGNPTLAHTPLSSSPAGSLSCSTT